MGGINWNMEDPIIQQVQVLQDNLLNWNISLVLRERWAGSLGSKVITVALVECGLIRCKDIDSATWIPALSGKKRTKPAKKMLTFYTKSEEYPTEAKIEIEISEQ